MSIYYISGVWVWKFTKKKEIHCLFALEAELLVRKVPNGEKIATIMNQLNSNRSILCTNTKLDFQVIAAYNFSFVRLE